MNISTSLITKYNTAASYAVVSSYPEKGKLYGDRVGGIASFAKNTIKNINRPAIILAEILTTEQVYEEGNTLVIRCFRRNDPRMWTRIIHLLRLFPKISTVLIQYDFALYGDIITSGLVIPFLAALRLMRKHVSLVLHAGITDVTPLAGHIGLSTGTFDRMKLMMYTSLFRLFYMAVGILGHTIIVTEEDIRERLRAYIASSKLIHIPHGVDTKLTPISKQKAKKLLGIDPHEYVVLYFGFINWYKGADVFAEAFHHTKRILGKNSHFIMAGGESATLNTKGYYKNFFTSVYNTVDSSAQVRVTGFVKQEDIATYFSSADLVVFPYRAFMSASGPLSLAYSYNKPFIVSDKLAPMFTKASDVTYASKRAAISIPDITFHLNSHSIQATTTKVLRNGLKARLVRYTRYIAEERAWKRIAEQYEQVMFAPQTSIRKNRVLSSVPAYAKAPSLS